MKRITILKGIVTVGLSTLMLSCFSGASFYTNASMGSTSGYVVKPEYNGESNSATYVTSEFGSGNIGNGAVESSKVFGSLNIHKAHTYKDFNFYYGTGVQLGVFKFGVDSISTGFDTEKVLAGDKSYYSFQVKSGINYLVSKPYADFRVLGIDLGFIHEDGKYFDTLAEVDSRDPEQMDIVEVFSKRNAYYLGLSSEVVFKLNKKNSIGINPFLAKSFLTSEGGLSPNVYGIIVAYRYSDFTFSFLNESNNQYGVDVFSCKFGLSYKLN